MTSTYPSIAIEAIKNGFDGAWERLIAAKLRKDFDKGHSEATELVLGLGPELSFNTRLHFIAKQITSSTIQNYEGHEIIS